MPEVYLLAIVEYQHVIPEISYRESRKGPGSGSRIGSIDVDDLRLSGVELTEIKSGMTRTRQEWVPDTAGAGN